MNSIKHISLFFKRHSPTIMSCLGAMGIIATTLLALKISPEIQRRKQELFLKHETLDKNEPTNIEYIKETWDCYIPIVIFGASSIACVFYANLLNQKRQNALISAYMILDSSFKAYKQKIDEQFGKDSSDKIQKSIIKDKYNCNLDDFIGEQHLFWELNYGEFFECNRGDVLRAENRLNEKFASDGLVTLNDFYELLGLPKTEYGDTLCWIFMEDCSWIDFNHELLPLEDGMECYIISFSVEPHLDCFPKE